MKKTLIFIFLFLLFLVIVIVATFLIIVINKSPSEITTHSISQPDEENKTDGCFELKDGRMVCFVKSIEISKGETIEESFDVSLDNPTN